MTTVKKVAKKRVKNTSNVFNVEDFKKYGLKSAVNRICDSDTDITNMADNVNLLIRGIEPKCDVLQDMEDIVNLSSKLFEITGWLHDVDAFCYTREYRSPDYINNDGTYVIPLLLNVTFEYAALHYLIKCAKNKSIYSYSPLMFAMFGRLSLMGDILADAYIELEVEQTSLSTLHDAMRLIKQYTEMDQSTTTTRYLVNACMGYMDYEFMQDARELFDAISTKDAAKFDAVMRA